MYVGHVGIALAMRRLPGAPPLWLLVLAAQGCDWGDTVLAALGRLGSGLTDPAWQPHGLVPLAGGAVVAAVVGLLVGSGGRGAALAALAYLSHWAADFLTGTKPTWPSGPLVGLHLYDRPLWDLTLEVAVTLVGVALWLGTVPGGRRVPGASRTASLPAPRSAPERRATRTAAALLVALVVLQAVVDAVMLLRVRG